LLRTPAAHGWVGEGAAKEAAGGGGARGATEVQACEHFLGHGIVAVGEGRGHREEIAAGRVRPE